MRAFMDDNFLLETETARTLYHNHAAGMPIIDYHCHINPAEIMENRRFDNLTRAWLEGDHYKWRLMRANGVEEEFVTGSAPDRDKFQRFAEALPRCVGNPVYHWAHLELKRYFHCDLPISGDTAQEIWDITGEQLKQDALSVRGIIKQSNVQAIATTDDPADDLRWHKQLAADPANEVTVVPTLRPDKAVNIGKPGFAQYISALEAARGTAIRRVEDLKSALLGGMELFGQMGCRASDHGLDYIPCRPADTATVEAAFQKGLQGQPLSLEEAECFQTDLMLFFGREFAARGWVMQLHYGALRNANSRMFRQLGPDTGYDAISTRDCARGLVDFLAVLDGEGKLPKTVLYSLNPNDNAMLDSVIGCFQDGAAPGKIQHGSAWWFNDSKPGMEQQLLSLASQGVLGNFIGMLTDSRSFLSYTRHEYFRRILCNLLGKWAEGGEYPADTALLGSLAEDISYRNTARYFGFACTA